MDNTLIIVLVVGAVCFLAGIRVQQYITTQMILTKPADFDEMVKEMRKANNKKELK